MLAHDGFGPRALATPDRLDGGLTPAEHIRAVKLARVRADLLSGRYTVAEAASRWGFAHAGHLAARYRHLYGEPPHRTRSAGA